MTKKTTIAIVVLVALLGISAILPGPSDSETEKVTENWKRELIEMAKKDRELARVESVFSDR